MMSQSAGYHRILTAKVPKGMPYYLVDSLKNFLTSHQLLTKKTLDVQYLTVIYCIRKSSSRSIPRTFPFHGAMIGSQFGRKFLPNIDFGKYFFLTWKKMAILKPMYYGGIRYEKRNAVHTVAAGSILSAVFLCAALPIRMEEELAL